MSAIPGVLLSAVRRYGVVLHVQGDRLLAKPQGALPLPLKAALKEQRQEILQRLTALSRSFTIVMAAFKTPPDEAAICWQMALDDIDAAEAAFHGDALLIECGWRPLHEDMASYFERMALVKGVQR